VARLRYLVDTSALARLNQTPVAAVIAPLVAAREAALCAPVAFELGYSARSAADHAELADRLHAFPMAPVTDADHERALELQGLLAERGQHRALSLVDALVAAVAETRDLTILHYDADFELVSDLTGQPHEWVVERGTAD